MYRGIKLSHNSPLRISRNPTYFTCYSSINPRNKFAGVFNRRFGTYILKKFAFSAIWTKSPLIFLHSPLRSSLLASPVLLSFRIKFPITFYTVRNNLKPGQDRPSLSTLNTNFLETGALLTDKDVSRCLAVSPSLKHIIGVVEKGKQLFSTRSKRVVSSRAETPRLTTAVSDKIFIPSGTSESTRLLSSIQEYIRPGIMGTAAMGEVASLSHSEPLIHPLCDFTKETLQMHRPYYSSSPASDSAKATTKKISGNSNVHRKSTTKNTALHSKLFSSYRHHDICGIIPRQRRYSSYSGTGYFKCRMSKSSGDPVLSLITESLYGRQIGIPRTKLHSLTTPFRTTHSSDTTDRQPRVSPLPAAQEPNLYVDGLRGRRVGARFVTLRSLVAPSGDTHSSEDIDRDVPSVHRVMVPFHRKETPGNKSSVPASYQHILKDVDRPEPAQRQIHADTVYGQRSGRPESAKLAPPWSKGLESYFPNVWWQHDRFSWKRSTYPVLHQINTVVKKLLSSRWRGISPKAIVTNQFVGAHEARWRNNLLVRLYPGMAGQSVLAPASRVELKNWVVALTPSPTGSTEEKFYSPIATGRTPPDVSFGPPISQQDAHRILHTTNNESRSESPTIQQKFSSASPLRLQSALAMGGHVGPAYPLITAQTAHKRKEAKNYEFPHERETSFFADSVRNSGLRSPGPSKQKGIHIFHNVMAPPVGHHRRRHPLSSPLRKWPVWDWPLASYLLDKVGKSSTIMRQVGSSNSKERESFPSGKSALSTVEDRPIAPSEMVYKSNNFSNATRDFHFPVHEKSFAATAGASRSEPKYPERVYAQPGQVQEISNSIPLQKNNITKTIDFPRKREISKPRAMSELEVMGLANRVYDVILERVKQERQIRGW